MRQLLCSALFAALAASAPSHAALRTYDATVTITSIEIDGAVGSTVRDRNGIDHALGDVLIARMSFDDAALAEARKVTLNGGGEFDVGGKGTFELLAHGGAASSGPMDADWGAVRWARYGDHFLFDGREYFDNGAPKHLYRVALFDGDGDLGSERPWSLGLDTFAAGHRLRVIWADDSGFKHIEGRLSALADVSPVPEPSAYAMLLAGALLVGGAARARNGRKT